MQATLPARGFYQDPSRLSGLTLLLPSPGAHTGFLTTLHRKSKKAWCVAGSSAAERPGRHANWSLSAFL